MESEQFARLPKYAKQYILKQQRQLEELKGLVERLTGENQDRPSAFYLEDYLPAASRFEKTFIQTHRVHAEAPDGTLVEVLVTDQRERGVEVRFSLSGEYVKENIDFLKSHGRHISIAMEPMAGNSVRFYNPLDGLREEKADV